MLTLYRVSYSEDLGILDLRSISIGFPHSKNMRLSVHFFGEVRGSNSIVLILLIRIFPTERGHSTGNCMKFAHANFLVLIVHSRGEKNIQDRSDTESRNSTRIELFEVQFREITLE